jgi:hypothetical protein
MTQRKEKVRHTNKGTGSVPCDCIKFCNSVISSGSGENVCPHHCSMPSAGLYTPGYLAVRSCLRLCSPTRWRDTTNGHKQLPSAVPTCHCGPGRWDSPPCSPAAPRSLGAHVPPRTNHNVTSTALSWPLTSVTSSLSRAYGSEERRMLILVDEICVGSILQQHDYALTVPCRHSQHQRRPATGTQAQLN